MGFRPRGELILGEGDCRKTASSSFYELVPMDGVESDPFLPRRGYRYVSPDGRNSLLVMIEGSTGLLDPFVDANDELGYGLSYEDAYLTLRDLQVDVDTIYDVETVVNSIPEGAIWHLMDEVEDEVQAYEAMLRREALARAVRETRWFVESGGVDDVADPKWWTIDTDSGHDDASTSAALDDVSPVGSDGVRSGDDPVHGTGTGHGEEISEE